MKKTTHVLLAAALGSYIGSDIASSLTALTVAGLASLIPDIDVHFKHRRTLHNIFALSLCILGAAFLLRYLKVYNTLILEAIAVGWLSHILADMLNIQGVRLLHPFSDASFSLKIARSNNPVLNITLSLLSITLITLRLKELLHIA
ncbi:metal-dependent hydrolase [Desulfurococcus mucosus]|uniref:Membrane-bound metal-dependent hydrolase n=1 Tax=Desulfurococcus mucosus (strain ATCC 35584 / DSM 2162 / JCM 9187 / O7/1) TaxID=765177 RepID=E8R952_DESM0|nr:metal-dependent hydrolase [Desulfurococcus mucosus]ADV65028.1 membrane-bound metal-dependent hydrolase [Desulfurococcus mucosus DSM 2162]